MGRDRKRKGHDTSRDSGPFVAMPCVVLDSAAYLNLSHPAKALLMEIARQCNSDNNGRLLASRAYLSKRGWNSADTITRALKELIAAKLVHQTVQGHRPNKASWYALTWRTLDRLPGYDAGAAECFDRGSYAKRPLKNASLKPPDGLERSKIGPPDGPERVLPSPPDGPIKAILSTSPSPPDGHHLDKPSPGTGLRVFTEPGNYKRLSQPNDGRGWLPAGLFEREAAPASLTRKATKQLGKVARGVNDVHAIQAGRAAGLTLEQLTGWAEPEKVAQALAAGRRPWLDLWTLPTTPQRQQLDKARI
jgi:hypothetical protein